MANSETILSQQTHPGDSVIPDNPLVGNPYKGDGYYGRSDGLHTIQYALNGFRGTISIEATLAAEPEDEDWFTVYSRSHSTSGSLDDSTLQRESVIENFTGNYVWIRAKVSNWADGTVNFIKLNH
jgi:hypothetical protein